MMPFERVVFDCNVYFQALISPQGPAKKLFDEAMLGRFLLFSSQYVLDELRKITSRPSVIKQFSLKQSVVDDFMADVAATAIKVDVVPQVFTLPRDPEDAHYVDLALAANAKLIVSRDKDLLSLRDASTPEGRDFQTRFPQLEVLTPPEMLARLPASP